MPKGCCCLLPERDYVLVHWDLLCMSLLHICFTRRGFWGWAEEFASFWVISLARSSHLLCASPCLNVSSVTCWVCPMLFPALFWIRFSPGLRVLWCFLCHTVLVGDDEVWFALQLADFLVCLKCILLGLSLLTFILLSFLFAFLGPCPWEVFCPTVLQLAHVVSLQHHAVLLVASSWTRPLALCRDFYSLILSYSGIDVSWSSAVCPFFSFLISC